MSETCAQMFFIYFFCNREEKKIKHVYLWEEKLEEIPMPSSSFLSACRICFFMGIMTLKFLRPFMLLYICQNQISIILKIEGKANTFSSSCMFTFSPGPLCLYIVKIIHTKRTKILFHAITCRYSTKCGKLTRPA